MRLAQIEANKPKEEYKMQPIKEEITIDDFSKIDLRVVKVLACEPIKGAKKLLKLITVKYSFYTVLIHPLHSKI